MLTKKDWAAAVSKISQARTPYDAKLMIASFSDLFQGNFPGFDREKFKAECEESFTPGRLPGRPAVAAPAPAPALQVAARGMSVQDAALVKRGPGRPKGSKNKPKEETATPTVAAVVAAAPAPASEAPKRGPGRPPGSKNKASEVIATAPVPAAPAPEVKRGPGRPPGSKNKPKELDANVAALASVIASAIKDKKAKLFPSTYPGSYQSIGW